MGEVNEGDAKNRAPDVSRPPAYWARRGEVVAIPVLVAAMGFALNAYRGIVDDTGKIIANFGAQLNQRLQDYATYTNREIERIWKQVDRCCGRH